MKNPKNCYNEMQPVGVKRMDLPYFNEQKLTDIFSFSLENINLWEENSVSLLNQNNDKMPIRFNKRGVFKVKFLTIEQIHFFTGKTKAEIISAFEHFDAYSKKHIDIQEKHTCAKERINHVTELAYSQKWGKPGVRFSANTWSYEFCLMVAKEFKWDLPSLREWHIKKVVHDSNFYLNSSRNESISKYFVLFANHLQELSYKIRFHSKEDQVSILNLILNEPDIHSDIKTLLNKQPWKEQPFSVHHHVLDFLKKIQLEHHLIQNVKRPTSIGEPLLIPSNRF